MMMSPRCLGLTGAIAALAAAVSMPAHAEGLEFGRAVDVKAARLMFSEALFGWCGQQVAGHAFVPTKLDPSGPGWTAEGATPRKGAGARINTATGVILELKPDRSSCFVQIEAPDSARVLAPVLRKLIALPPLNGVPNKDVKGAEGHGTVYAVRAGKDGAVVAISINDYEDRPRLLTGVMTLESPAPDAATGPARP